MSLIQSSLICGFLVVVQLLGLSQWLCYCLVVVHCRCSGSKNIQLRTCWTYWWILLTRSSPFTVWFGSASAQPPGFSPCGKLNTVGFALEDRVCGEDILECWSPNLRTYHFLGNVMNITQNLNSRVFLPPTPNVFFNSTSTFSFTL